MAIGVRGVRVTIDPLIAEAKRRRRQRRVALALAALPLVVLGAGVGTWVALRAGGGGGGAGPSSRARAARIETLAGRATIVEAGITAGVGWAMNGVGLWLTADGGTSWLPSVPPHVRNIGDPVARISQIRFADRRHGWIAAADVKGGIRPAYARHMEIDRTADGGRTWRWSLPPGCAESCNGANLSFLDPRRGFALVRSNDPPRLYTTADGGASWELVSRPPFAGRIVFLDPRIGLGTNGALYRTENGGRTWRRVRLTSRPATVDPPTFFGRDGVVPVRIRTPGTRRQLLLVYTTKDGGATWERHPGPALRLSQATWGLPLDALFSAPSPNDWVVAGERLLAVTADAGRSWRIVRPVDLPPRASIWQVVFTSARDGWAIFGLQGEGGAALVRTSDGGRTWTPLAPPVPTMR